MQSLFYGAAAASVAGLLLGAGFRTAPQPPAPPQQEAVYAEEQPADDGFQPAYLQGAVYTSAATDWASADRPSQAKASEQVYREPKFVDVSYDADPPPQGDDIPTPSEPAAAPATAPSSTAPGPSVTPAPQTAPGAPTQRQDDGNTPASRASSARTAPARPAPANAQAPNAQSPATPAAPGPGQPQPDAASPGPQGEG